MLINNGQIPVDLIVFAVKAKASSVSFDVSAVNKPSTLVTAPGFANSYLKIDTKNLDDTNIINSTIKFKVPISWFIANNVKRNTIKLYRYKNGWQALETVELPADSTYAYYQATTPGFSYFAIAGVKTETSTTNSDAGTDSTTTDAGTQPTVPETTETNATQAPEDEPEGSSNAWIWITVGTIIVIAVAIYFFLTRKDEDEVAEEKPVHHAEEKPVHKVEEHKEEHKKKK
jgi:PGF-pre-PGF domain-containing protein